MYIKFGFFQLKKNISMNLFVMIQLIIMFFLTICISSIVSYYYNYYHHFSHYFDKDGWFYYADYAVTDDGYWYQSSKKMEQDMRKTDVASCYDPSVILLSDEGEEMPMDFRAYDEAIIDAYTPEVEYGEWIETEGYVEGTIRAVISKNEYGIKAGDVIYLTDVMRREPENKLKVEIMGVLEDGARVVGYPDEFVRDTSDYQNMYYDYYLADEEKPLLLMNIEEINAAIAHCRNENIINIMGNTMLFRYHDDISKEDITYNEQFLISHIMTLMKYRMKEIRINSMEHLKEKLMAYVPIFLSSFILTLISAICVSAIVMKQQLQNYAIYSICGMSWRRCASINRINIIIVTLLAVILTFLIGGVLAVTGIVKETTISFGVMQVTACVLVAALYILLASVIPGRIIKKSSVRDILIQNGN